MEIRAVQGARGFSQGAYKDVRDQEKRSATMKCDVYTHLATEKRSASDVYTHFALQNETVTVKMGRYKQDKASRGMFTNSKRVRDNAVLRRIYTFSPSKAYKLT